MYDTIENVQMLIHLHISLGLMLGRFTQWEKPRLLIENKLGGRKNCSGILDSKTLCPWRKPKNASSLLQPVTLSP